MYPEEVIFEIFRRIAAGEPGYKHGDFLTLFAKSLCHADALNKRVLLPAAIALVREYGLTVEGYKVTSPKSEVGSGEAAAGGGALGDSALPGAPGAPGIKVTRGFCDACGDFNTLSEVGPRLLCACCKEGK